MNLKRHLARLAEAQSNAVVVVREPSREGALEELRRKMNDILERKEDREESAQLEAPTELGDFSAYEAPRKLGDFSAYGVPRELGDFSAYEAPRELGDFSELDDLVTEVSSDRGSYYERNKLLPVTAQFGLQELAIPEALDAGMLGHLALDAALGGVNFERALFLDTETTGLGTGAGVLPFLVGLGWFEDGRFRIRQFLLAAPEQEPAMLLAVAEQVRRAEVLVTYNGKSFDWPLLEARFVMNRLPVPKALPHLDLLHVARRLHKQRLGRCNLKAIEAQVLGFERVDDIDGAEVATRYAAYLRTGRCLGLRSVIEHNTLDVLAMAALVSLYGDPELKAATRDPIGVVRTLKRAKLYELALTICGRAIAAESGVLAADGSADLYAMRAEIHRALGDRERAIADLEQATDSPHARLQLAKLYEHFLKRPELALEMARRGTTEAPHQALRRQLRLAAKLAAPVVSAETRGARLRPVRPTGPKRSA